jgi:hypothetical protein
MKQLTWAVLVPGLRSSEGCRGQEDRVTDAHATVVPSGQAPQCPPQSILGTPKTIIPSASYWWPRLWTQGVDPRGWAVPRSPQRVMEDNGLGMREQAAHPAVWPLQGPWGPGGSEWKSVNADQCSSVPFSPLQGSTLRKRKMYEEFLSKVSILGQ